MLRARFAALTASAGGRYGLCASMKLLRLLPLVALAAACGKKDAASYRLEPVTRGPVSEIVNATGDVSAIVTVNVGSQVSGIIDRLFVDFNSKVRKGQVLATLDQRLFRAQLERADASLEAAKANVEKAQAALADSERILKRDLDLRAQNLIAQADVDTASATRDGNRAALSAARAAVLQAKADRDTAAVNLIFTRITSPIDGVVVSRNVDIGQTVAAAFQAPTLFLIANDLTKMQILANIDEADVGKVHEGLEAKFTVDAFAGETFSGTIREVRQAPNTIQNVVTYAAVIDAPNPEHKLRQGMTASVTITTARKEEALRVSNAALRFRPDDQPAPSEPPAASQRSPPMARSASAAARGRSEGVSLQQGPGRPGRVYKLENGKPVPVNVRVGLSDGQRSEVIEGLADGDKVIVGEGGVAQQKQPQRRGPF
jgi:HlyD family secretion protein